MKGTTISIKATKVRGDSEHPLGLTKAQTLTNLELPEALDRVNIARKNLGYRSPCQGNPSLWDGVSVEDSDHLGPAAERVTAAREGCRSCLVLSECRSVRAAVRTNETEDFTDVSGMIAGEWVDKTETGARLSHYLEYGRFPEGVVVSA